MTPLESARSEASSSFDLTATRRADGAWLLEPLGAMAPCPSRLTDRLVHWAGATPDATFIAERDANGNWRRLSYAETLQQVRSIGAGLLSRRLSTERPVAILSGNSIEHQLLALAAMYVGIPYVPVSPAYSLTPGAIGRLDYVLELMTPGLVAVFGGAEFSRARAAIDPKDAELVSLEPSLAAGTAFRTLHAPDRLLDADAAHAQVRPDTIAKFLLTSGSTGNPKAVITTQRMLASNQAMLLQAMPFMATEPPVLVDWLPWNHVFGGSHNIGIALMNGGSYFIDGGRPTPAGIAETARNLKEIAPTIYLNVPRGYDALLPCLRQDAALRGNFFSRLRATFVAAAGLSQESWDGYLALSRAVRGSEVPMINGLGATETAPSVTFATNTTRAGFIGLPAAGCHVKLAPVNDKLEMRVRGPNVTPGYWRDRVRTAAAFDEEGYYRLGDAVKFADPDEPRSGLLFDGRIAEDFKLSTGTWVSVGPLRAALLAALAPLSLDVVIAGPDRDGLVLFVIPDARACAAEFATIPAGADVPVLAANPGLRAAIKRRLQAFAATHPGSSTRIVRAMVLPTAPSLGSGEVTDKGTINQRAVLENRRELVELMYSSSPPPEVIVVEEA